MRIIGLEQKQYDYLLHVFESYTRAGMPPPELAIAADTFQRIVSAPDVPVPAEDVNLGPAKITDLGPNGVALEVAAPGADA